MFSNYFSTPIKSAMTEIDFSKMLCSLHASPTWSKKMLAEYWISSEILQLQWKFTDPSAFSLFTQKMIFWVMNQVHSYLQLPALWCFFVTTVLPFLPYGAVGATSSLEQMAGQLSGKSEIDSHLWQMVKRAGKEEIKEILSHDSMFKWLQAASVALY